MDSSELKRERADFVSASEPKPHKELHVVQLFRGTFPVVPEDVDPLQIQSPDGRCLLRVRSDGSQEWRSEDAAELISIMVKELLTA